MVTRVQIYRIRGGGHWSGLGSGQPTPGDINQVLDQPRRAGRHPLTRDRAGAHTQSDTVRGKYYCHKTQQTRKQEVFFQILFVEGSSILMVISGYWYLLLSRSLLGRSIVTDSLQKLKFSCLIKKIRYISSVESFNKWQQRLVSPAKVTATAASVANYQTSFLRRERFYLSYLKHFLLLESLSLLTALPGLLHLHTAGVGLKRIGI